MSHEILGETPQKVEQLQIWKFKDFLTQIADVGVIDPAESKSGLILTKAYSFTAILATFCQEIGKILQKPVCQRVSQIRP